MPPPGNLSRGQGDEGQGGGGRRPTLGGEDVEDVRMGFTVTTTETAGARGPRLRGNSLSHSPTPRATGCCWGLELWGEMRHRTGGGVSGLPRRRLRRGPEPRVKGGRKGSPRVGWGPRKRRSLGHWSPPAVPESSETLWSLGTEWPPPFTQDRGSQDTGLSVLDGDSRSRCELPTHLRR